jgi:hypothetical protein
LSADIPVNLLPGAGADLTVQFDDPGVDAEYEVEIPLQHLPFMFELLTLDVHGIRGTAEVDLFVDTLSAEPGQLVDLRVYLRNARNIALFGATGIRATLRFHSSLLVPVGSETGSLIGDERVMELTIPLLTDAGDVALRIPMMVTLGTAEESTLMLSNVEPIGGDLSIAVEDGHFTLLGICREGGTRLFDGGAQVQLKPNRPNPFNPSTDIEFVLIERGHNTLRVYDALGRSVATLARRLVRARYAFPQFHWRGTSFRCVHRRAADADHGQAAPDAAHEIRSYAASVANGGGGRVLFPSTHFAKLKVPVARVAELADALDSKSSGL